MAVRTVPAPGSAPYRHSPTFSSLMYTTPRSSSATQPSASDPTANSRTSSPSSNPSPSVSRISNWRTWPAIVTTNAYSTPVTWLEYRHSPSPAVEIAVPSLALDSSRVDGLTRYSCRPRW